MRTKNFLIQRLSQNLKEATSKWMPQESKSGVPLLFHQDYISEFYRELFGIPFEERALFQSAFRVVTEGKGGEISKINSVASSSLLSLLTFYRLFLNRDENLFVIIPGLEEYRFTKCYFEIQNKVIGNPSCVDVVLEDCKNHVLLFLESKLSEYFDAKEKETYGKSYISLYRNLENANVFEKTSLKIGLSDSGNLLITSPSPQYIEGIKQSISHLIGIFQGPQDSKSESYLEEYEEYAQAFDGAEKIFYATILYHPGSESDLFENYKNLYSTIIAILS